MPPKAKFTRSEVTKAALRIAEESGIDALTARSLGEALGSSPRPIFTVFDGMNEVRECVIVAAKEIYGEYVERGLGEPIAFKGVGESYIAFAAEHPRLFSLLFMRGRDGLPGVEDILPTIDDHAERILMSVVDGYGVSREVARRLYLHLWIYTHGIATLVATRVCSFTPDEISSLMTEEFLAVYASLGKREGKK